jgi:hypothetical protein
VFLSLSHPTLALSHRKPAPVGTFCDRRCATQSVALWNYCSKKTKDTPHFADEVRVIAKCAVQHAPGTLHINTQRVTSKRCVCCTASQQLEQCLCSCKNGNTVVTRGYVSRVPIFKTVFRYIPKLIWIQLVPRSKHLPSWL